MTLENCFEHAEPTVLLQGDISVVVKRPFTFLSLCFQDLKVTLVVFNVNVLQFKIGQKSATVGEVVLPGIQDQASKRVLGCFCITQIFEVGFVRQRKK